MLISKEGNEEMKSKEKAFYNLFTELQCSVLANASKSSVNGITATHYTILEYLYHNDMSTGKQIAQDFQISAPAISRQIKFLLEHDFIQQTQSKTDRRTFYMSLTKKGKDVVTHSESFRASFTQKAHEVLTKEEIEVFQTLLAKILQSTT